MGYYDGAGERRDVRYTVSVEEYITFRRQGFLVVRGLLPPDGIEELRQHTEELMQGRLPEQAVAMAERDPGTETGATVQGLEAPPAHLSPEEKAQYFLRIHMLHRKLELHERYLLHPRVLDVLEGLIGPDMLALQTMLFLKPPGKPGQGWHQDSFYIPTFPDTLCGAWIAIDDCDERNGAMWFATGSQHEPVYPPLRRVGGTATATSGISVRSRARATRTTRRTILRASPTATRSCSSRPTRAMWSFSPAMCFTAARPTGAPIVSAAPSSAITAMRARLPNGEWMKRLSLGAVRRRLTLKRG